MSQPRLSKVPHTFVLLFSLVILAVIGTHLLPAGEFDRVKDTKTNKTIVVAGTYHRVDGNVRQAYARLQAFNL